ncbi:LacI family DNA-binding transcriptional regulator [Streptomyces roseolus]|uniref:LacI family DNA-binding transcriptional regulator n=1 Tax=Streptomyces roseolus TaxID=67358 RepID=UPI0036377BBC
MAHPAEDVRTPAMADVAREAGVSRHAVSRVLSGHPDVRAATRERVTVAIERLGYRRDSAARPGHTPYGTLGDTAVNTVRAVTNSTWPGSPSTGDSAPLW